MGRLPGFDYKRPFFYMVTVKRARGVAPVTPGAPPAPPFSRLEPGGTLGDTALTPVFRAVIERFHETWWCIEPIHYYIIMPDHLHLIIKIRNVEGRVSLSVVVRQLIKALERASGAAGFAVVPLFENDWHDWIVKKRGQLAAFQRYIAENGRRAWLRHENRRFFTHPRTITFQDKRYWAYGNEALLQLPVIVAIKGHRSGQPKAALKNPLAGEANLRTAVSRVGPGGAGLSTFLSTLEKEAGNAIIRAGGALIVLSMHGFAARWHPTEKQERLCAAGRMLYLSPYEPQAAKLSKQEMYLRAHALVDWAIEHSTDHLEAWP